MMTIVKSEMSLQEGSTVNLQGMLLAAGRNAAELIWSSGAVKGGVYLLSGKASSFFTQADIDAGFVSFRHDGGLLTALPKLTLSAGGDKSVSVTPVYSVTADNDAPILVPKVGTLGLGKSLVLSSTLLGVKDEETALVDLQFSVKSSSHLLIKVAGIEQSTFSGLQLLSKQVTITHDGSTSSPALRLGVSDGQLETSAWLPLRFSASDKLAPLTVLAFSGLAVAEAATVTLTRDLFTGTTGSDDAGLLVSVSSLKNGWFTLNGVKSTSFTLAEVDRGQVNFQHSGAEAAASFKLSLKSAQGKSAATAITVLTGFTQVADAPVISLVKPLVLTEGGTVKFGGNFKVSDGDTLAANFSFSVVSVSGGTVELNGTQVSSFRVSDLKNLLFRSNGDETSPQLKISVTDGTITQTLDLPFLYTHVDDLPVLVLSSIPLTASYSGSPQIINLKGHISVVDGDNDPVFSVGAGINGTFKLDGMTVSDFSQSQIEAGRVEFSCLGGAGQTVSWSLSVNSGSRHLDSFGGSVLLVDGNRAPVVQSMLNMTMLEESTRVFTPVASDPEGGVLTYSFSGLNASSIRSHVGQTLGQVDADTGAFDYTAPLDKTGNFNLGYLTVRDERGKTTTVQVSVNITNVNDAPVMALPAAVNMLEDGTASGSLTASDVDLTLGRLVYALAEAPLHGQASVTSLGAWTYTPDANWSGVDNFRALVRDPSGAMDYATVVVTVAPVNDAPVWGAAHLAVVNATSTQLSMQDLSIRDLDGDKLSFSVTNQAQGLIKVAGVAASSFTSEDLRANKVTFEHDGSGVAPALNLRVNDGTVSLDKTVSVSFAQSSPAVTMQLGDLHLERLTPLILTSTLISATDGVHPDDGITFYADLQNASLEVHGLDGWVVSDHFTMADVNAGKVRISSDSQVVPHQFRDDPYHFYYGYLGVPEVSLYASNGAARSAEAELSIKYNAPNHSPQLQTMNGWIDMEHRIEGLNTIAFVKLTTAMLSVTDVEDDADHLRYSSLAGTKFYLDGSAVDSFTQAELEQGRVEYRGVAQELPFRVYDSASISSFPKALHLYDDAMLMTATSWGSMKYASNSIVYSFSGVFNQAQLLDIHKVMLAIEKLVNVEFIEGSDAAANLVWNYKSINDPEFVGHTAYTLQTMSSASNFHSVVNFDASYYLNHPETGKGSQFYVTVLHELGHALGLQHPYGQENALYGNNSIMSYSNFGRFFIQSELTLTDIRTLQELYGARAVGAGDDVLVLESPVTDPNAPDASRHYQETRSNNTMTLVDAGGNNTLDLRHLVGSYSFDLDPSMSTSYSQVYFGTLFSTIYCADSSLGGDAWGTFRAVYGSALDEKIIGGSGFDILSGGGGDDVIDGGAGYDLIQLTIAKSIFGGIGDDLLLVGARPLGESLSTVTDNFIDLSTWDLSAVNGFEGIAIGQGMVKLGLAEILALRQGSESTSPFLIEAREGGRLDLDMTDFVKEADQSSASHDLPHFHCWAGADYYRSVSHPELELAISKDIVLV